MTLPSFPISLTDIITLLPVFILVTVLFYFSNKEVRKSLEESIEAQELLSKDRDMLVKKLEQNTQELYETRLARFNELAKAAEFGRLAQGLFHDLITPLTSIILHTEKLKEIESAHRSVEKTIEASNRMAGYIKDMRATLAREEVERQCILSDELKSVLHLLDYRARTGGVQVQLTKIEECEWFGSPTKIRQVFLNLITNALDSFDGMRDRNKTIEIELYKDKNIIFKIKDNGCGISKENQPKIFEPFFTTKSQEKGTGIGLATVIQTVEKYLHGKIDFESELGNGTTFTISFPPNNTNPVASPQPQHKAPGLV